LGLALFASGAQQDAKTAFEYAVKLDPDLVEARINLGQLQENENDMSGAIAQYRRALQGAHRNPDAAAHLARALVKTAAFDEARSTLDVAIRHHPGDSPLY